MLIGMTTIDAMEPVGKLDVGMKEHFLKTKDARYTPAWIWGMSDMRALTAAMAEKDVFQPMKVIATGGSKRGVATAAAGIADDRFTAIMPVVAPIIDRPADRMWKALRPAEITKANEQFLVGSRRGKNPQRTGTARDAAGLPREGARGRTHHAGGGARRGLERRRDESRQHARVGSLPHDELSACAEKARRGDFLQPRLERQREPRPARTRPAFPRTADLHRARRPAWRREGGGLHEAGRLAAGGG